jgi:hypothetical protein
MSVKKSKHRTKGIALALRDNDTRKQAGNNRLDITVNSEDWRIPDQMVSMTIREAKALKSFLNSNLDD